MGTHSFHNFTSTRVRAATVNMKNGFDSLALRDWSFDPTLMRTIYSFVCDPVPVVLDPANPAASTYVAPVLLRVACGGRLLVHRGSRTSLQVLADSRDWQRVPSPPHPVHDWHRGGHRDRCPATRDHIVRQPAHGVVAVCCG